MKSGMNHLSQNIMGLSEFPDTHRPIILHFGGDIGDRRPCHGRAFEFFLNFLKLFLAVARDFTKSL